MPELATKKFVKENGASHFAGISHIVVSILYTIQDPRTKFFKVTLLRWLVTFFGVMWPGIGAWKGHFDRTSCDFRHNYPVCGWIFGWNAMFLVVEEAEDLEFWVQKKPLLEFWAGDHGCQHWGNKNLVIMSCHELSRFRRFPKMADPGIIQFVDNSWCAFGLLCPPCFSSVSENIENIDDTPCEIG